MEPEPRARGRSKGSGSGSNSPSSNPATSVEVGSATDCQNKKKNFRPKRIYPDIIYTRPTAVMESKTGTIGTKFLYKSNYFRLQTPPGWGIFSYKVEFSPAIENVRIRRALLRVHKDLFEGYTFDGSLLLSSRRTNEDTVTVVTKKTDGQDVFIAIKFIGQVRMTETNSLLVLNLVLRKAMQGLKLQQVGRNFFDALAKISIREHRLELWPGYVTSIRQHEHNILLCAEISSKVMRMETLYDILTEMQRNNTDYREQFAKLVLGSTVLTDYSNKTYRVDEIDWEGNPNSTFDTKEGKVSYIDYYRRRYQINIRDENQPLVLSRIKEKQRKLGPPEMIALIPELCRATGLTDEMRTNFRLMKAVAEHTRIGPGLRVKRLIDFNQRIRRSTEAMQVLSEWNMVLDQNLIEFQGRELPAERIVFRESETQGSQDADWTRDFRNQKLYSVIPLTNWHLIVARRATREAEDFVRVLQESVKNMGFQIVQPSFTLIDNDRNEEVLRAIDNCVRSDSQCIMIIVSNNNPIRYSAIKKKCCVDRAIATQVIIQKTIQPKDGSVRSLMSVATKVAIQLNCKLGAAPWFVRMPLAGLMTVGFDVCHDTRNKTISYGALVASMDLRTNCRYYSVISAHNSGEELSSELAINMIKSLEEYRKVHGSYPAKILFFRDGVNENQIHYVIQHEVENLKKVLAKQYASVNQELRFAFVIVNKRLNTRIFKGDRNPLPGTVVDDAITLPERYDFYLVSQSVRQGTVSPTSYSIVFDSLQLTPNKMQILTYKMCHLYYNWSGTTRVPAVCQYAHKLAFLVGQYIHTTPNQSLQRQLYFL